MYRNAHAMRRIAVDSRVSGVEAAAISRGRPGSAPPQSGLIGTQGKQQSRMSDSPSDETPDRAETFAPGQTAADRPAQAEFADLPEAEVVPGDERPARGWRRRPGPGLVESLVWVFGVLLVHIIGGAVGIAVLLLSHGDGLGGGDPLEAVGRWLDDLDAMGKLQFIGIEQAVFVAAAVLAVALRRRADPAPGRLSFRPIRPGHLLVILGLLLPVSVVATQLTSLAGSLHAGGAGVERPDQAIDTVRFIGELARDVPLWLLVLVIAAAPAIGEEVVFRGLIGRGLVARLGLPAGVLATSLLFAAVHGQPLHIVSVLPLGVVIHVVYLATGSFWAPVLYHFLNNAMAAVLLKVVAEAPPEETAARAVGGVSGLVVMAAMVCVSVLLAVLWKSRIRYRWPDGSVWDPGYVTADAPPSDAEATAEHGRAGTMAVAAAVGSFVLFLAVLGASAG